MAKDLQQLGEWKVGDKVCITGGVFETKTIGTIDRITEGWGGTLYVKGDKYDKRGWQRSDGYHRKQLEPLTEEAEQEVYGIRARNRLQRVAWAKLEPSKALEIFNLLKDKINI